MTFEEWFHKEYEPADLQIKQYAERKEGLHIPATVYLEDLKKAFEAGLKQHEHDYLVKTKKIRNEYEAQIEEMQEKLKADLIAELKEQMQYSTSPSCTKGMELFIKSIEKWEIKEND